MKTPPSTAASHDEVFAPSAEFVKKIQLQNPEAIYQRSIEDPEAFWEAEAEKLEWFQKWDRVLDQSDRPFFKWFVGGKMNIVQNAVDRHQHTAVKNKIAYLWENEKGETRQYTYAQLFDSVNRWATLLKEKGARKGEVITIYMPLTPELPIAMLACAKIGAIHSVVYGGFSTEALATRMQDAKSKILITGDGGWRRGKTVDLKDIADGAMEKCPDLKTCLTLRHTQQKVKMKPGRDFWIDELLANLRNDLECATEPTSSEDPLFILYTSGTTGKPKGLVHTHGGYAVYTSLTHRTVFDLRDDDKYWCTADPGWITGHSYNVYGPLINGATIFLYEGAPNFPEPDRWWQLVEKYKISLFYTSPTAIRGLMRFGDAWPQKHDLTSLRILGSVGEPINPEAWKWYYNVIGQRKCPIMDTWWQTETGGFMITPLPSTPLKPGSATKPFFGQKIAVVDEHGTETAPEQEGMLVLKNPSPGFARTIWGDPDRYRETYWKTFAKQGWYQTGDSARIDRDGYAWIIGRMDDVIKVSGYRLGTAEIESALVSHPQVSEAAAIGLPHELKGQAIHAFVVLRHGVNSSPELTGELMEKLREHVAHELGPIAKPEQVQVLDVLPKTRSGKIMRRVLKARALGQDPGDVSTLEE